MSYRDIEDYWADRRCIRCDGHLDRRGAHCVSCMLEIQDEIDRLENERVRRPMVDKPIYSLDDTVKFLDDQFQKIFKTRE